MANEWQSLLQQSPNIAGQDLIKNFQSAYGTAQEQKKTAYDQFRLQKAQDIVSKARRADGTMDWDAMFTLGSEAGIGLDAFNQVHKMQTDRRASELAVARGRMQLEALGYDPSSWDPSAKPMDVLMRERQQATEQGFDQTPTPAPSAPQPYVPPTAEQAKLYDFVTNPAEQQIVASRLAGNAPGSETQNPQVPAQQFGGQGVGETAQTSMPSSAPVQAGPQDIVVRGSGAGTVAPQVGQLPAPAMRDSDNYVPDEGYANTLWRAQRSRVGAGAGDRVAEAVTPTLSIAQMKTDERDRLSRYLAMRGISEKDQQTALTALENMAIKSVPVPANPETNPYFGMLTPEKQAEAYAQYTQDVVAYPSKVEDARVKLSEAIRTGNTDVLDKSLAVQGNERAIEQLRLSQEQNARSKQEYVRNRQAAETLVNMGVTAKLMPDADVKALQDVFIPAIADIKQAGNGFGGAMQAAVAMSKVDGSVNFDNVLSKLIAMGAMPSDAAAQIKTKLTPEAYTNIWGMIKAGSFDEAKEALRAYGVPVGVGSGATNKNWETSALQNVFQQAQAHGMTKAYFDAQKASVTPWGEQAPADVLPLRPDVVQPVRQERPKGASGGYSETKVNGAGMKMGRRKSDGKWEPVR